MQIDELWEAGNRGVGQVALDLGPPDLVTENVEVRRASVDQPERHARVDRMQDRALPLDPQEVTSLRALDDQPFRGAREEVGHHRVHGNPPAGDRDAGLAGRDEHGPEAAPARLEVELAGRGHLPDRAVRADREHDRRVDVEVRAGRGAEVRWGLAEVTQLDVVPARELDQLRVVLQAHVEAVLDVEAFRDAGAKKRPPVGGEASALRDDADERRVRVEAEGVVDARDDRDAVVRLPRAPRVEDGYVGLAPVAHDAAERLAVVQIVRVLLSED